MGWKPLPVWTVLPVLALLAGLLASCRSGPAPDLSDGWSNHTMMPTDRSEITASHIDGWIYVAGGISGIGISDQLEAFSISDNRWETRTPLPKKIHHIATAAHQGKLYATGGYTSLRFTPNDPDLWIYDPHADQWAKGPDMPAPRGEHAMVSLGGKIWVVGGRGPKSIDLWAFDPGSGQWTSGYAPMPTYRHSAAAVSLDGKIWVLGGRLDDGSAITVVEVYDPQTDRWTIGKDLPSPRAGHGAAVIGGRIHVFGGEILDQARVIADHDIFDPKTGLWTSGPAMQPARHGVAVVAAENRAWVIGGGTKAGWRTVFSTSRLIQSYSPD